MHADDATSEQSPDDPGHTVAAWKLSAVCFFFFLFVNLNVFNPHRQGRLFDFTEQIIQLNILLCLFKLNRGFLSFLLLYLELASRALGKHDVHCKYT